MLPYLPKKEPRPIPLTVRISRKSSEQLKALAREHNLSQADVIEHLIQQEFKHYQESKNWKAAEDDKKR